MNKKNYIKYLGVFFLFFSIFLGWHFLINDFLGTDPYYHAKHSYLMLERGDFTLVEPWAKFHFLENAPVDPWWLYHVLQAGFIYVFGIILGTKVLTAVLASLVFSVFYFILKKLEIYHPFIWTVLFFFASATFTIRLLLERPFVLSISYLLFIFYLTYKRKNFQLFLAAALYILFYNMAPLILMPVIILMVTDYYLKREINLRPTIFASSGLLLGIFLHPNTLNYFHVIYTHFIKVFYLRFAGINLHTGAEIQMQGFHNFLEGNIIILLFYIIAVALFLKLFSEKKVEKLELSLFLISAFWFVIAMLVPRGVEYWVPFGFLFIAIVFYKNYKTKDLHLVKEWLTSRVAFSYLPLFIYGVLIVFAFYNIFVVFNVIVNNNKHNENYYFTEANDWLKNNTAENEVIFYPTWSMFPRMFFYNNYNRYLTAFDPTFFYAYNPKTYYTWANISYHGVYCSQKWPCMDISPRNEIRALKQVLVIDLDSKYILLENRDSKLLRTLEFLDRDFKRVYQNKKLLIFSIL